MRTSLFLTIAAAAIATGALVTRSRTGNADELSQAHSGDMHADVSATDGLASQAAGIPASSADAAARLAASPRRAEWRVIKVGATDSVVAWVVYPQNTTARAPVVIAIHENMGLNAWTRGVADQLAADGFIAIAPDMITMKRTGDLRSDWAPDAGRAAIGTLTDDQVRATLQAVAAFGLALPNAGPKYGIVGFCWGGARSFQHAVHSPTLGASVVYYGTTPPADQLASIRAPVLGLYGGNDARITSAVPATDSAMKSRGKTFESHVFPGAAHGFLGRQEAGGGPNLEAAKAAWPLTVAWFRTHLRG